MSEENLFAKMEKLEAQIRRCTRQSLKVIPCLQQLLHFCGKKRELWITEYCFFFIMICSH